MNVFDHILSIFKKDSAPEPVAEVAGPEYLQLSFHEGPLPFAMDPPVTLELKEIGSVELPSGHLVSTDPFVTHDAALLIEFPGGTYPVTVAIMHQGTDQRVAFARLQLSTSAISSWKMAMTSPENDVTKLKPGHIFGFGVDSGTASFMDQGVATALVNGKDYEKFQDELMARLDETYVHTWSWATMPVPSTNGNLVAFSSGYGDGIYATYVGFDTQGNPVCAVIDFGILDMPPKTSGA